MSSSGLIQVASDAGPLIALAIIAWVIKAWMDARVRGKLAASSSSPELIHAILLSDHEHRRLGPLRWGMVFTFLALGLAIIEAIGWQEPTPGVFALLLGATGFGNLAFFGVGHWLRSRGLVNGRPKE